MGILNNTLRYIEDGKKGDNIGYTYSVDKLNKYIKIWQGRYYLIFALSGVGKSKFVYHQHIFNVIDQQINDNTMDNLHIDLYSLEISPVTVMGIMLIFYLKKYKNILTDTNQLFSYEGTINDKLQKYINDENTLEYMNKFESYLTIYTTLQFPILIKNTELQLRKTGTLIKKDNLIDSYTPNNSKQLYQIIIDHISLIKPLKSKNLYESISVVSKYLFAIRDLVKITPVIIQQVKTNRSKKPEEMLLPGHEDLRDSPETFQDCDIGVVIGNPFYHKIKYYNGYKIYPAIDAAQGLQDRFRIIEIRKSRYSSGANHTIPVLFVGEASMYANIKEPLELKEPDYIKINNIKKTFKTNT